MGRGIEGIVETEKGRERERERERRRRRGQAAPFIVALTEDSARS